MNDRIINWNLDPTIYWITETFPLKYYGLFFMTGILLAHYVAKRIYIKENIPKFGIISKFFTNCVERDCVRKVAVLTAIIFEYLNNLAKKQ